MSSELCFMSASVLAHEIRARRLSATEVMDAHIAQIERLNPALTAIVTFLPERGREHARAVDAALARGADPGPLAGLPVAHNGCVPTAKRSSGSISLTTLCLSSSGDRQLVTRLPLPHAGSITK